MSTIETGPEKKTTTTEKVDRIPHAGNSTDPTVRERPTEAGKAITDKTDLGKALDQGHVKDGVDTVAEGLEHAPLSAEELAIIEAHRARRTEELRQNRSTDEKRPGVFKKLAAGIVAVATLATGALLVKGGGDDPDQVTTGSVPAASVDVDNEVNPGTDDIIETPTETPAAPESPVWDVEGDFTAEFLPITPYFDADPAAMLQQMNMNRYRIAFAQTEELRQQYIDWFLGPNPSPADLEFVTRDIAAIQQAVEDSNTSALNWYNLVANKLVLTDSITQTTGTTLNFDTVDNQDRTQVLASGHVVAVPNPAYVEGSNDQPNYFFDLEQ